MNSPNCRYYYLMIIIAIMFAGCALPGTHDVTELKPNTNYWFSYDASRRGAILSPKATHDQTLFMCAEPSPDVALQTAIAQLGKVTAAVSKGQGEVEALAQKEFSTKVVELASRTQTILFLREAMYRLCEQQMNGSIDPKDAKALYEAVVDTSITLAEAQVIETLSRVNSESAEKLLRAFINGQVEKRMAQQQERQLAADEKLIEAAAKLPGESSMQIQELLMRKRRLVENLDAEAQRKAENLLKPLLFEREKAIRDNFESKWSVEVGDYKDRLFQKEQLVDYLQEQVDKLRRELAARTPREASGR